MGTQSSSVYVDEANTWSLASLSRKADRFNQQISPVVKAVGNTMSLVSGAASIGKGVYGALTSPSNILENFNRTSASNAMLGLRTLNRSLANSPENFTMDNHALAQKHIGTIDSFLDSYGGNKEGGKASYFRNNLTSPKELESLRSNVEQYKNDFSSDVNEFEKRRQESIAVNQNLRDNEIVNRLKQGEYGFDKEANVLREIDDAINSQKNYGEMADSKYSTLGIQYEFDKYKTEFDNNIDKNTTESIQKSTKAVKDMSKLIKDSGRGFYYARQLNEVKYKFGVRSRKWTI